MQQKLWQLASASLVAVFSLPSYAQFSATTVQPPTTTSLNGSAALWDGYDNVFYAEGTALVQRYWSAGWGLTVVDRTNAPLHPTCSTGTNGEISARYVGGYHDVFYISFNSTALRHAYYNWGIGLWVCETIEWGSFAQPVGADIGGTPHVYYVDVTRGVLRHAFWTGTSWQKEDIDGLGLTGPGQCNCRVTGTASNSPSGLKSLAVASFLSTQQVLYRNNTTGALRHAFKAGGGGGSWNLETLLGPGANVPGYNLPNAMTSSAFAVTVVGDGLHVFSLTSSSALSHLWWSPGTGWRLVSSTIGSAGADVLSFSATNYLGGWSVISWVHTGTARSGRHFWGQGDQMFFQENFSSSYSNQGSSGPSWIDAYVGGDGYLNAYLTYRDNWGNSVATQFWR